MMGKHVNIRFEAEGIEYKGRIHPDTNEISVKDQEQVWHKFTFELLDDRVPFVPGSMARVAKHLRLITKTLMGELTVREPGIRYYRFSGLNTMSRPK